MKYSMYDILSNLIPGFLILFALAILIDKSLNELDITASIVLSYIIGYLNNTLSSWIEDLFNWSWGGKPSDQLLEGKSIWKVTFYQADKAKEYLIKEIQVNSPSTDSLFQIALRYAITDERVKEFNSNYALSRNLILSFTISSVIVNFYFWFNTWILAGSAVLIFIMWIRAKQRGYYFAREVLNTYIRLKEKDKE
ncbi:MAG: hypothetical protein IPJ03_03425 [Ignavibacteriales bacterium]|nr:hypothetical protein [Ignavibacteriales bacterium]